MSTAEVVQAPNRLSDDDDVEMTDAHHHHHHQQQQQQQQEQQQVDEDELFPSLIIPVTSSNNSSNLFIEIFPEELPDIASSTILQVLKDEGAQLNTWADAALLYMQQNQSRESSTILEAACDHPSSDKEQKVRILASAGIALLTQAQASQNDAMKRPGGDTKDEFRSQADDRFTHASKVDTLFPMTWIGRGMLNLSLARLDQARFFFDTTLKQCGAVLPALLGMAAVMYGEKNYVGAQDMYMRAMRLFPQKSGASVRVGFGLACYKLGQVDRAKAAFARALEMDHESVEAMVGAAILDMASLDETSSDFGSRAEKAIKMISMANLLDHSNAMVQNHLANHYFWKWTPVTGTVTVTEGSNLIKASQIMPLDPGERVRIGTDFETYLTEDNAGENDDDEEEEDSTTFRLRDTWKGKTIEGLKLWKKDYDRVIALAKGAYSSTSVREIQAESLFFLARVYHVREEYENALKFYEKACKLAPGLCPARYGLAQVLIMQEKYDDAMAHLKLVIGTSNKATDALALLGLLEVKNNETIQDGLVHLRKAIDLDPLSPELIILEALALQQHQSNYTKALDRYKKAVELMKRRGRKISHEIFTNIGVLCHETKAFDEALENYTLAFDALDEDGSSKEVSMECDFIEGGNIVLKPNELFYGFADTNVTVEVQAPEKPLEEAPTDKPADETDTGKAISGEPADAGLGDVDKADSTEKDASDANNGEGAETPKEASPKTVVRVVGNADISSLAVKVGDHIRIGDFFESEVASIESKEGFIFITLNEEWKATNEPEKALKLYVKRGNKRLNKPEAISIAFNLARLHEAVGRTLAAIEIHKAIVKRNPAYVNSYLRLACIARDCGCLNECAEWLKIAATTAPGNPEVLTLIGNLHLSLCDWQPAQNVFDGLLAKKVPNVEAYAMLSLGNIYFANIHVSAKRYSKHLQYASDYYKRILSKDTSNAYAANGLGTVLAEKGELFKAKEVFNRVREVQDNIADALLNLGHIYLAQKKHPEALQMYGSYMKRTEDGTVPITSKSRVDDLADVELYIAFAYFDWARHTELFNNVKAAPADERYQKAMEHLQQALARNPKKEIILKYNLCMTKLQAGNCILQKLTRNIRRTAKEVEDALTGLEDSLVQVEALIEKKTNGEKIPIPTSTLNDFVSHCKANIASAKSHLADERKREEEATTERELQRLAAEAQRKEEALRLELQKEEERRKQEEMDQKAEAKMKQVETLRAGWQHQEEAKKAAQLKKTKTSKASDDDFIEDAPLDADGNPIEQSGGLFDESEDESDDEEEKAKAVIDAAKAAENATQKDLFGDSDDGSDIDEADTSKAKNGGPEKKTTESEKPEIKENELFGDSDDGSSSDEELLSSAAKDSKEKKAPPSQEALFGESDDGSDDDDAAASKRPNESVPNGEDEQPKKKRKVAEEDG